METQFLKENQNFLQNQKILLAVSAGVDSMVLLYLMEQICNVRSIIFGVAHVNHQLRKESKQEAAFLKKYCQQKEIPFYETSWQEHPVVGTEEKARAFRYQFFETIMDQEKYELLFTAHHADDQAETMLMRFVRSGGLAGHAGIKKVQPFAKGQLVRPLLLFSKAEIAAYAKEKEIPYFDDQSNFSPVFFRNRIRHNVLPELKTENPQVLAHFQQFSQQILRADAALHHLLAKNLALVTKSADGWQIALQDLPASTAERYYFLTYFFQEKNLIIGQKQLEQVLELLTQEKTQWSIDLSDHWHIFRSYQVLGIEKKNELATNSIQLEVDQVGQVVQLSPTETVQLSRATSQSSYHVALSEQTAFPLVIRRRKAGDRIRLTAQLTKRVSRYLIDQKIPQKQREQLWVVEDSKGTILALLPFVSSYLSIGYETDKIHYILEYNAQTKS